MPNIPVVSAKEFLRMLLRYGCILISIQGSHFKVENPANKLRATVPVHANKDISKGFAKAILDQLDINVDDFFS